MRAARQRQRLIEKICRARNDSSTARRCRPRRCKRPVHCHRIGAVERIVEAAQRALAALSAIVRHDRHDKLWSRHRRDLGIHGLGGNRDRLRLWRDVADLLGELPLCGDVDRLSAMRRPPIVDLLLQPVTFGEKPAVDRRQFGKQPCICRPEGVRGNCRTGHDLIGNQFRQGRGNTEIVEANIFGHWQPPKSRPMLGSQSGPSAPKGVFTMWDDRAATPSSSGSEPDGRVQALDRALRLLEALSESPDGMRLRISRRERDCRLRLLTVLLTTLEHRRFVQFDRMASLWHVSRRAYTVGAAFLRQRNSWFPPPIAEASTR